MIAPPGTDESASLLELLLVLIVAVLGIVAMAATDIDPPRGPDEWGDGPMSPDSRAPVPARTPTEASWRWDSLVP